MHEQLVEGIVVGDDDLMERYLNGETIDYGELEKSLAGGVAVGQRLPGPVLLGRQRRRRRPAGPPDRRALPQPRVAAAGHWPPPGPTTAEIPCDPGGQTLLTVTKTFTDSHTGKMSLCKVVSGTLHPDTVLINPRTREEERLHALQSIAGQPPRRPRWWSPETSWPCPA